MAENNQLIPFGRPEDVAEELGTEPDEFFYIFQVQFGMGLLHIYQGPDILFQQAPQHKDKMKSKKIKLTLNKP